MNDIPLIDLAGTADPTRHRRIAAEIAEACERIGFFGITGHGVPQATIDRIYDVSRAFFDLPAADKSRVGKTGDVRGGLMYYPFQEERLAATLGEETPGDLKESLDFGPGFMGSPWPAAPADLEAAWRKYFRVLDGLAGKVRKLFAIAIGLPEDTFDDAFRDHLSSLRVLNYPELDRPPLPGQLRAGAHTDYGYLTILLSEDKPGGLQVQRRDGTWIDAPAVEDGFIVNIGDAMMRWTEDRWISTPHRAALPPADTAEPTRRQSIAFFNNPARDAVIECLAPFRRNGQAPKYPPITYGEYASLRYSQAHPGEQLAGMDEAGP